MFNPDEDPDEIEDRIARAHDDHCDLEAETLAAIQLERAASDAILLQALELEATLAELEREQRHITARRAERAHQQDRYGRQSLWSLAQTVAARTSRALGGGR